MQSCLACIDFPLREDVTPTVATFFPVQLDFWIKKTLGGGQSRLVSGPQRLAKQGCGRGTGRGSETGGGRARSSGGSGGKVVVYPLSHVISFLSQRGKILA